MRHGMCPKPRQMLPLAMLLANLAALALTPWSVGFAVVPLAYLSLCAAWGGVAAIRARDPWLLAMGGACAVMHMAWAIGFLRALSKRQARNAVAVRRQVS